MAMAGTGGGPVSRGRTSAWLLAALLLAILVGAVVAYTAFDDPPTTATRTSVPAGERQETREETTQRLVNEGYLPKGVLR